MTRNDSDADWMKTADEEASRATRPHRRERQPMTWPTAAVLVALFGALVVVAWLCSGVTKAWIVG